MDRPKAGHTFQSPNPTSFVTISYGSRTIVIPRPASYSELRETAQSLFAIPKELRFRLLIQIPWAKKEAELAADTFDLVTHESVLSVQRIPKVSICVRQASSSVAPAQYLTPYDVGLGTMMSLYIKSQRGSGDTFSFWYNNTRVYDTDTPESLGMSINGDTIEARLLTGGRQPVRVPSEWPLLP